VRGPFFFSALTDAMCWAADTRQTVRQTGSWPGPRSAIDYIARPGFPTVRGEEGDLPNTVQVKLNGHPVLYQGTTSVVPKRGV
jgi:hypothetical protein